MDLVPQSWVIHRDRDKDPLLGDGFRWSLHPFLWKNLGKVAPGAALRFNFAVENDSSGSMGDEKPGEIHVKKGPLGKPGILGC